MTEPVDVRYLDNPPWESASAVYVAALHWIDRIKIPQAIVEHEASRPGPKRKIPYAALLFGAMYHLRLRRPACLHLSAIAQELELLTKDQKVGLGIRGRATTKNFWLTQECLIRQLQRLTIDEEPWVDPDTGEVLEAKAFPEDQLSSFDVFINWVIAAAIPDGLPSPDGIAVDGTGVEAYATRKWPQRRKMRDSKENSKSSKNAAKLTNAAKQQEWGSADSDARMGYKTPTENHPNEMFFGYEAHFGVDATPKGSIEAPRVIRSFVFVPAGSSKAAAGLSAVDIAIKTAEARNRLTTVYADRGYSMLAAVNWQLRLWSRGLRQVMDLAKNQRGERSSPHPCTVFIDGGLFTSALPQTLRDLPSPSEPNIGERESRERAKHIDERSHYAYRPLGARNPENGHQRFKGPVNSNKLCCPNHPETTRLANLNPETTCTTGSDCGCKGTFTITPDEYARESQWPLFGTTAWRELYGSRNAVESFNADVRTNKLSWRRGYVKAFTRSRNALLLSLSLASLNFRIIRDWCFRRRAQDLWGGEVWDFGPEPKKTRQRRTKPLIEP
jgi:hypothetical protein